MESRVADEKRENARDSAMVSSMLFAFRLRGLVLQSLMMALMLFGKNGIYGSTRLFMFTAVTSLHTHSVLPVKGSLHSFLLSSCWTPCLLGREPSVASWPWAGCDTGLGTIFPELPTTVLFDGAPVKTITNRPHMVVTLSLKITVSIVFSLASVLSHNAKAPSVNTTLHPITVREGCKK